MDRLLILAAISLLPLCAGCAFTKTAGNTPASLNQRAALTALPTPELQARRASLAAQIAAIEGDVEMKAGLHMGVTIGDDRGRLTELYREASAIEKELLRRSAYTKL